MARSKEIAVATAAKAASDLAKKRKAQEAKDAAKGKAEAHLTQSKANRHPTAKRPRVISKRSAVPEPEEEEEEEDEDDEAAEDANDSDANGNGGAGQREDAAGAGDDSSTDESLENARQV